MDGSEAPTTMFRKKGGEAQKSYLSYLEATVDRQTNRKKEVEL